MPSKRQQNKSHFSDLAHRVTITHLANFNFQLNLILSITNRLLIKKSKFRSEFKLRIRIATNNEWKRKKKKFPNDVVLDYLRQIKTA